MLFTEVTLKFFTKTKIIICAVNNQSADLEWVKLLLYMCKDFTDTTKCCQSAINFSQPVNLYSKQLVKQLHVSHVSLQPRLQYNHETIIHILHFYTTPLQHNHATQSQKVERFSHGQPQLLHNTETHCTTAVQNSCMLLTCAYNHECNTIKWPIVT